jgi:DNA-binding NtrC family response regulator
MSEPTPANITGNPNAATMIFVVDDNALLVEFAATVLKDAGYAVRDFLDPRDVLQAMAADPKPTLLITDFDMGGMTGLELIVNSRKIHPSLKTILLSGTVNGSIILSHPAKVQRFLGKPYQPAQLKAIVAELLKD